MLQQTQVSRVISKYREWLEKFPDVQSLAKASTRDVLLHWSGLGYNRRALYLQQCAKAVVKQHEGTIPQNKKLLKTLPGIGEYTAQAILCFAFDEQVAVVDTNVRKVILTHFPKKHGSLTQKEIQHIANQLLPKGKAYEWNQALMDYAAVELKQHRIPMPRQSRFQDSDRYYRGQILRYVLKRMSPTKQEILREFAGISTMTATRFEKVLRGLCQDNLIMMKGRHLQVKEE